MNCWIPFIILLGKELNKLIIISPPNKDARNKRDNKS